VQYDKDLLQIRAIAEASFQVCLWVQVGLIAGSLLSHAVFAASRAGATHRESALAGSKSICSRKLCSTVAIAFLRGLCNLELPYQLHRSSAAAEAKERDMHYLAALHSRLTELVFEAPQICVNLMVLLLQLALNRLSKGPDIPTWKAAGSFVSAFFGLISLTVAATEFTRPSPRSFWSGPPPTRLFLGLVDMGSTTWVTTLLTGIYCLTNLFNATFFLTFFVYDAIIPAGTFVHQISSLRNLPVGVTALLFCVFAYLCGVLLMYWALSGCCCGCCGCCEGIGSSANDVLHASIISLYVLIPWVSKPRSARSSSSSLDPPSPAGPTGVPAGLRTLKPVLVLYVISTCAYIWLAVFNVSRYVFKARWSLNLLNNASQAPDILESYGKSESWEAAMKALVLLFPCFLVLNVVCFISMTVIRRKQRLQGHIQTVLCKPTYMWCPEQWSLILQSDELVMAPDGTQAA
jgi:hypothetical protein